MKDNRNRLIEVMGKIDNSFKPKMNETWADDTNNSPEDPFNDPTEPLKERFETAVEDLFEQNFSADALCVVIKNMERLNYGMSNANKSGQPNIWSN